MRADYLRKLYKKNALPEEYLTVENLKLLYDDEMSKIEIPDDWDFSMEQFDKYLEECDFDSDLVDFCIEKLNILEPNQESDLRCYHGAMKQVEKVDIKFKLFRITKKVVCALTIVACSLASTQMIGKALGVDLLSMFIDNINQSMTLRQVNLNSDNTEITYGFDYLPEGSQLIESQFNLTNYGHLYVYQYNLPDDYIVTLQVQVFLVDNYNAKVETNGNAKEFKLNGQVYYEATNNEDNVIVWVKEPIMYNLHGEVPAEVLRDIIKNNERSY